MAKWNEIAELNNEREYIVRVWFQMRNATTNRVIVSRFDASNVKPVHRLNPEEGPSLLF